MNRPISLIGAPTDIGAGTRGASMGPEALRVADIQPTLEGHGLEVIDRGNLSRPGQPVAAAGQRLPPPDRGGGSGTSWCTTRCTRELQLGRLPILLGGDHCLAIGSISAVARHCREQAEEAARVVARCACRLQHQPADAQRQHPRHAGGLPVRPGPAGADRDRRHGAGARTRSAAPDRHPQRRCRREAAGPPESASRCSTCATSTRWACATRWSWRWPRIDAQTRICT